MSKPTTLPLFNPSDNPNVADIKRMTEEILIYLRELPNGVADARCKALALTNYEQAAMWAVKSLFVPQE